MSLLRRFEKNEIFSCFVKWDVKIALYLFLAYSLYGVSYLISDGDYVVPLPMLFIFIPVVSMAFLFTSGFNKYSLLFLLIPLVVMSNKVSQYSPGIGGFIALLSIASWIVLGLVLLLDNGFKKVVKDHWVVLAFPISCLLSVLFLLDNPILMYSIFLLIGIVSAIIIRDDDEKYHLSNAIRRLIILAAFTSWMFLITALSVYLV